MQARHTFTIRTRYLQSGEFLMHSDEVGDRDKSTNSAQSVSSLTECDWLHTEFTESDWLVSLSHDPQLVEESGEVSLFDLSLQLSIDTSIAVLLASLLTSKIVFVLSSIV